MVLAPGSKIQRVHGVSDEQLALMKAYVQGAVYSWIKNRKGEWFAVRDLVGGENFEWDGTPLLPLYEKHVASGKTNADAVKAAGRDIGWIAKAVLAADKRTFEADNSGYVSRYRWKGGEP